MAIQPAQLLPIIQLNFDPTKGFIRELQDWKGWSLLADAEKACLRNVSVSALSTKKTTGGKPGKAPHRYLSRLSCTSSGHGLCGLTQKANRPCKHRIVKKHPAFHRMTLVMVSMMSRMCYVSHESNLKCLSLGTRSLHQEVSGTHQKIE